MTRHDVAKFVSRIFSIFALFETFSALREFVYTVFSLHDSSFGKAYLFSPAISMLLYLIIGLLLWVKADYVANKIIGDSESAGDKLIIRGEDIQSIAYSTIGLYLIVQAIPTLASNFMIYLSPVTFQRPQPIAILITSTLQLIIGIWLFFSAKGLTRMVQKLRVTETDKT